MDSTVEPETLSDIQQCIAVFRGLDTNNTGLLDSDGIKLCLTTLGNPLSEEESEEAVGAYIDGDGMINYEAMCVDMFSGIRVSEYHAQIAASPMHIEKEKELAETTEVVRSAVNSRQVAIEEKDRNQAEGCCVIQ